MTPLALLVLLAILWFASDFRASPPVTALGGRYFADCSAARATGAAPLHEGEPGYRRALDRDSDGIACEPYPG